MPRRVHPFPPLLLPSLTHACPHSTQEPGVSLEQVFMDTCRQPSICCCPLWCRAGASVTSLLVIVGRCDLFWYFEVNYKLSKLGFASSRSLQWASHQVCTQLLLRVLYSLCTVPLFPSYTGRGTTEPPGCWSTNKNGYPSNA